MKLDLHFSYASTSMHPSISYFVCSIGLFIIYIMIFTSNIQFSGQLITRVLKKNKD